MTFGPLCIAFVCMIVGHHDRTGGVIEGVVVNATRGRENAAGTEVVLRVRVDGQFVSVTSTTTQPDGRFRFEGLPTGTGDPYLPGANQNDVHFPGPRILLTAGQPHAKVELKVFESASQPNPLVIENLDIVLHVDPGSLKVTETMLINNPSLQCYVGRPIHEHGSPVTLQLTVPSEFKNITFDREAFGRRFAMINETLVTGIPWPPGKRELSYTYVIANEESYRIWERPLDLPCSRVSLTVKTETLGDISCNLQSVLAARNGDPRFESKGDLPAGHVLQLELGHLPVPIMVYARYTALLTLVGLVVAVSIVSMLRQRKLKRHSVGITATVPQR